jgi:hypothetical protein
MDASPVSGMGHALAGMAGGKGEGFKYTCIDQMWYHYLEEI